MQHEQPSHNWKNIHPGATHYGQAQYQSEASYGGHEEAHTMGKSTSTGVNKLAVVGAIVGLGVITAGTLMFLKNKKIKPSLTGESLGNTSESDVSSGSDSEGLSDKWKSGMSRFRSKLHEHMPQGFNSESDDSSESEEEPELERPNRFNRKINYEEEVPSAASRRSKLRSLLA